MNEHGPMRRNDDDVKDPPVISMILTCPGLVNLDPNDPASPLIPCGARHIDKGAFATKAHHTHSCQRCGHTWRPAKEYTRGVHFIPGFKDAD